ncbi:hypothetical protein MMC20_006125 [Loxospora ochrophaea]|nr:hypothetical protein [Loxospora ochrophaea]
MNCPACDLDRIDSLQDVGKTKAQHVTPLPVNVIKSSERSVCCAICEIRGQLHEMSMAALFEVGRDIIVVSTSVVNAVLVAAEVVVLVIAALLEIELNAPDDELGEVAATDSGVVGKSEATLDERGEVDKLELGIELMVDEGIVKLEVPELELLLEILVLGAEALEEVNEIELGVEQVVDEGVVILEVLEAEVLLVRGILVVETTTLKLDGVLTFVETDLAVDWVELVDGSLLDDELLFELDSVVSVDVLGDVDVFFDVCLFVDRDVLVGETLLVDAILLVGVDLLVE